MRQFSRKEVYGADLGEYCKLADISPAVLIKVELAKLKMLRLSYEEKRKKYFRTKMHSKEGEYLSDLLVVIKSKIHKTEANLERYRKELDEIESSTGEDTSQNG